MNPIALIEVSAAARDAMRGAMASDAVVPSPIPPTCLSAAARLRAVVRSLARPVRERSRRPVAAARAAGGAVRRRMEREPAARSSGR